MTWKRALFYVSPLALAACSGTPKCDDAKALKVLADHGRDGLDTIVTTSVNDEAQNVTCLARYGSLHVAYKVYRTSDGKIAVAWQDVYN